MLASKARLTICKYSSGKGVRLTLRVDPLMVRSNIPISSPQLELPLTKRVISFRKSMAAVAMIDDHGAMTGGYVCSVRSELRAVAANWVQHSLAARILPALRELRMSGGCEVAAHHRL